MSDWILSACTIFGAAIYLRATLEMPELLIGDSVGPRFFPALVGGGLLLSGVLMAHENWRKWATDTRVHHPENAHASKGRLLVFGAFLWTALYYAAFEPLGYILATLIYILGLLLYFHRSELWINLTITAGFTAACYLVFAEFLHVVLPAGSLLPAAGILPI